MCGRTVVFPNCHCAQIVLLFSSLGGYLPPPPPRFRQELTVLPLLLSSFTLKVHMTCCTLPNFNFAFPPTAPAWDLLLCHSFGIQHDGNGNDCEPIGKRPFVMSPQLLYGTSLPRWSRCSRQYITRFLE